MHVLLIIGIVIVAMSAVVAILNFIFDRPTWWDWWVLFDLLEIITEAG